jgi:predicted transcriptional regulator
MNRLTEQEEEAMRAVWKIKGGFVRDFLEQIAAPKPPYTTLASTVKNLEKKGFLKSERMANSYRYIPSIKAEEYKKRFMKGFVEDYFKNSYKDLVAFFAKEEQISTDELKEIIDMIENRKSK